MKKLFLLVLIAISLNSLGQSSFYIAGGPTFIKSVVIPHLEAGVVVNKNVFSFACETYDHQGNRWEVVGNKGHVKKYKVDLDRAWTGMAQYARIIPIANSNFALLPGASAGMSLNGGSYFCFSGSFGLGYDINSTFAIQSMTQWPVGQNAKYVYKYSGVQTGLLLIITLFQ